MNTRGTFKEQLPAFKEFLSKQGMNPQLVWITKEQVSTHKNRYWIYKTKRN